MVDINLNDSIVGKAFKEHSRKRCTGVELRFSYSETSSRRLNGIRGFWRLCFASTTSTVAPYIH